MQSRSIHLIYAVSAANLDAARAEVELALDVTLDPHDSLYLGDYFRGALASLYILKLRRNVDPLYDAEQDPPEDKFALSEFPEHSNLLYVDGPAAESNDSTLRSTIERIPGLKLLQVRYLPEQAEGQADAS
jgi:hypothetical protein